MNKYNFSYRIIKLNGDVIENTIKAKHQKNAKTLLKIRFPGCNIVDCDPQSPEDWFNTMGELSGNSAVKQNEDLYIY